MARFPFPDQSQWRGVRTFLGRAGAWLLSLLQVTLFVSIGLLFVFAAALLISIIQFQIRIIEAKTQSRNFSLTSLTQSVEMQKQLVRSIRTIRAQDEILLQDDDLRDQFSTLVTRHAQRFCQQGNDAPNMQCITGLYTELVAVTRSSDTIRIFERYLRRPIAELSEFDQKIVEEITSLMTRRDEFIKTNGPVLLRVRLACFDVINYTMRFEKDFAAGYTAPAEQRCVGRVGTSGWATSTSFEVIKGPTLADLTQQPAEPLPGTQPATNQRSAPKSPLQEDLAGALFFDLLAYYRFYNNLFAGLYATFHSTFGASPAAGSATDDTDSPDQDFGAKLVEQIVIAPIDISFVLLVIICGALGAMLRITALTYRPELFGTAVDSGKKRMPLYYFIIGIMCSLIVYILAKTVFAGLADTTYVSKSGSISPFVIAFLAVVSGLLCEEAFQRIVAAGRAALARSTGGDGSKGGQDGAKTG